MTSPLEEYSGLTDMFEEKIEPLRRKPCKRVKKAASIVVLIYSSAWYTMNAPIIGLLQEDSLELIEEFLGHGKIKCVAFNCHGTLLAAGCLDGSCVIWDFQTRTITKVLWDKDCSAAITSICWSKYGHLVLVSAVDRSLTLWDFVKGNKIASSTLQYIPMHASLHPGSATPSVCLVCPLSSAPLLVDLDTSSTIVLPTALSALSHRKISAGPTLVTPTAASFNKDGDLVYVGNSKGEILIIDHESLKIRGIIPVPGGAMIKNIGFSWNGQYLHTNSSDGIIRLYENLLPLKDALQTLNDTNHEEAAKVEVGKSKAIGSRCLALLQEFQNSVTKVYWKASCLSSDGEWVAGASASKGDYKIYVWHRDGQLVKIIGGPKERLIDIVWHPVNPVILAVSLTCSVYIWGSEYSENSAFSPEFQELEENEESKEQEDEFDLMPTTENAAGEGSQSRSPHLEKAGQDDNLTNLASSSLEAVGRGTYLRKKKKLSEEVLNSQADDAMKPPLK